MPKEEDNPMDGVDPFARRLISQYLGRRKADIDLLRKAVGVGDFERIRVTGHNMSGSGSAYGLDQVSEVGAALEKAALAGDGTGIGELIDQLDGILSSVRMT